jgi:transposase
MMRPRLLRPQRHQRQLLPESLDELLPSDHAARVFAAVAARLNLTAFDAEVGAVEGLAGRPAFSSEMLLTAWLYATSRGIGSARELERLSTTDLAFRWIFGGTNVRRTVLTEFRVKHLDKMQALFTEVLVKLVDAGVVDVDFVAIDGVRLRANAGDGSLRQRKSLEELREQAELHVKAVLADGDDATVAKRVRRAREQKAKDLLERTERAIAAVEAMQAREEAKAPSRRRGPPRASPTDPDARNMKQGHNEYGPGFNARVAVAGADTGGPRTIVALEVTNQGTDRGGVTPVLDDVEKRTKRRPKAAVADKGFLKKECVEDAHSRGTATFIPLPKHAKPSPTDSPAMKAHRLRMADPKAKLAIHARAGLVELPFAWFRQRFRVHQLPVRGTAPVTSVVVLLALTFNIMQHAASLAG